MSTTQQAQALPLQQRPPAQVPDEPPGGRWTGGEVSSPRITKVGLWLVLLTLVLSIAAANTGNNSLYLVIAGSTGLLVAAWWVARGNVRGLELAVEPPEDIYAGSPCRVRYRIRRTVAGASSDLLLLIDGSRSASLIRRLDGPDRLRRRPRRPRTLGGRGPDAAQQELREVEGEREIMFLRRGLHRVGRARALSIFPMGLYRRQVTFSGGREVIVLPEVFAGVRLRRGRSPEGWRISGRRIGQSEDLHSLREFRPGDDPRSIHWKQSARNPELIFQQRSEDQSRRVSVLVDSYSPELDPGSLERFERLVSEAATACVGYLERGYEVELVLREGSIGFDSGSWHRRRVLEALALLACQDRQLSPPLAAGSTTSRVLRFSLSGGEASDGGVVRPRDERAQNGGAP